MKDSGEIGKNCEDLLVTAKCEMGKNEEKVSTKSKDGDVLIQVTSDTETSKTLFNEENGINKTAIVKYSTLKTQLKFLIDSFNNEYFNFITTHRQEEIEQEKAVCKVEDSIQTVWYSSFSFIIPITILQIIFYFNGYGVESNLRYQSISKTEVWRFWTYVLVHGNNDFYYMYIDVIQQLLFGYPLEKVFGWWRVMLVYLSGTISGSLLHSIANYSIPLRGARSGCCSILTAHALNVIMNRKRIKHYGTHLFCLAILFGIDIWWYMRDLYYYDTFLRKGILAHIGGVIGGTLIGIHIFRSKIVIEPFEKYVRCISVTLFFLLAGAAIFVDIVVLR